MKPIKEIAEAMRARGLKVTPQRIAGILVVVKLDYPRAEEIIREVSEQIPGLSPTTVYNTLDILVSKKIIRKVHTEADVMRYDAIADHHHHLYCLESDRMDDYFDPELDKLLEDYFRRKNIDGFRLKEVKLQLMGEFEKKR